MSRQFDYQSADAQTNPGATSDAEAFHRFSGPGIILNACIVGDTGTIAGIAYRFRIPGMKLMVVTYCKIPDGQGKVYDLVLIPCEE